MSLVEGLASVLHDMNLVELALAFVAVLAYSLAINGSYSGSFRSGAASAAFVAAVGFTTLASGWMSAVVFLALLIVGIAAFAGVAWTVSTLLGLGERTALLVSTDGVDEEAVFAATSSPPARAFAPQTSAMPL